jgi:hypothetical protein
LRSRRQADFIRELEQKNEGKTERDANDICCNKTQDYAEQSPARHCYSLTNLRWNELRQIFDCDALLFHRIAIA